MTTELRCECNDRWIIIDNPNFNFRNMVGIKCPICEYNMWYCAYQEDMMIDLKEMNE